MKYFLLLFCGLVFFISCAGEQRKFGEAGMYFPPTSVLKKGIVNKYYRHHIPADKNKTSSSNITYIRYTFQEPDIIIYDSFDAAFMPQIHKQLRFDNGIMLKEDFSRIYKGELLATEVNKNEAVNWLGGNAVQEVSTVSEKYEFSIFADSKQLSMTDTIIDNIPCKHFRYEGNDKMISAKKDTFDNRFTQSVFYAENIGLFQTRTVNEDHQFHLELIEQMSVQEFEKRKKHAKKRIAYIDPENTLDNNPDFKICNKEIDIGDYYNCEIRGQLKGGKGSWWRLLKKELIPEKLGNESGYLTYRFVLNCKGEAGRFITEQASLDFEHKTFPKETVDHFYNIVSAQTDWQYCDFIDKTQDAYTYVTFKLKDGKVIEILP